MVLISFYCKVSLATWLLLLSYQTHLRDVQTWWSTAVTMIGLSRSRHRLQKGFMWDFNRFPPGIILALAWTFLKKELCFIHLVASLAATRIFDIQYTFSKGALNEWIYSSRCYQGIALLINFCNYGCKALDLESYVKQNSI